MSPRPLLSVLVLLGVALGSTASAQEPAPVPEKTCPFDQHHPHLRGRLPEQVRRMQERIEHRRELRHDLRGRRGLEHRREHLERGLRERRDRFDDRRDREDRRLRLRERLRERRSA